MYITIRPSINKVKMWHNVRDAEALYNSLIFNRDILASDLDIYKVTCNSRELKEKLNFELIENGTKIEFSREIFGEKTVLVSTPWNDTSGTIDESETPYTDAELADIAFNFKEPDRNNWREVPNKNTNKIVEEITYEVVQTISVIKLNPFI